jgi:hypothetical protein
MMMNNDIKRSLFLMNYQAGKDLKFINESVDVLYESRQTEMQAMAYMRKAGIDDNKIEAILNQFRSVDNTKNKSMTMPMTMAYIYSGGKNLDDILNTFKLASSLVNDNKITLPIVDDNKFITNNKHFNTYEEFSDYVNEYEKLYSGFAKWKSDINIKTSSDPIFPRNEEESKSGIVIYDGNDVGRCIKYGSGAITGQYYQFCIGKPANTNWQSYRDAKGSTFYYVFDKNRDFTDPLHMTVVDRTNRENRYNGFEVTDVNNRTNNISKFGDNILGYLEYLKNKGVPIDEIFQNKPKTPEEIELQKKVGSINTDLSWFKGLDFSEKSNYIGRGNLLSLPQFKYLWEHRKNPGAHHLLNQYLNMGAAIPIDQFNILVGQE